MLCAVQTNDGRTTYFYYDTNGNLAEVAKPGNDDTSYQYQAVLNSASSTIGYQLTGIRSDLANDAVTAGESAPTTAAPVLQIQYETLPLGGSRASLSPRLPPGRARLLRRSRITRSTGKVLQIPR